jgi:hypothetical protein
MSTTSLESPAIHRFSDGDMVSDSVRGGYSYCTGMSGVDILPKFLLYYFKAVCFR